METDKSTFLHSPTTQTKSFVFLFLKDKHNSFKDLRGKNETRTIQNERVPSRRVPHKSVTFPCWRWPRSFVCFPDKRKQTQTDRSFSKEFLLSHEKFISELPILQFLSFRIRAHTRKNNRVSFLVESEMDIDTLLRSAAVRTAAYRVFRISAAVVFYLEKSCEFFCFQHRLSILLL